MRVCHTGLQHLARSSLPGFVDASKAITLIELVEGFLASKTLLLFNSFPLQSFGFLLPLCLVLLLLLPPCFLFFLLTPPLLLRLCQSQPLTLLFLGTLLLFLLALSLLCLTACFF